MVLSVTVSEHYWSLHYSLCSCCYYCISDYVLLLCHYCHYVITVNSDRVLIVLVIMFLLIDHVLEKLELSTPLSLLPQRGKA